MSALIAHTSWSQRLAELGLLREHELMARHTTLAVGGPARWFFRPTDAASLIAAISLLPSELTIMPLGRGSNLLVADRGIDAVVVDLSDLNHIRFDACHVLAGAGVRMSRLARLAAEHGLTGCEFLATVPGDIGGGVAMNAGAYAQQISDTLLSVELLQRSGTVTKVTVDELMMAYRCTHLPVDAIVLSASFKFEPGHPDEIRERIRSMRHRRSATQPLALPNCGSVFKNPKGEHAARLLEAAGLKGFSIGGASISAQHANFIVNEGEASSGDIAALITQAKKVVKEKFNIELETEVRMLGEWL
ncbi:MAG: UDP-N-acetylmuramate dehydrogenase [Mariprofundus sp.]|nr:UDP-N-acetylmuramate dehydrogenase [Mariprofundus sp.]